MQYLFFDIECANNFKGQGKICKFGYVITDEEFNVKIKNVIPMSPGKYNRFDLGIYKREPGFQWAYDFDTYYRCDEYPHYHDKIKKLLEDSSTLVLGHSLNNDIRYLDYTTKRYKLSPINFIAYDTQIMIRRYSENHEFSIGLKDAFLKLCGKSELIKLNPHLSRDDAYMTMRIAQEMCKKLEISLKELIEKYPDCKINTTEYLNNHHQKKEAQDIWKNFCSLHLPLLKMESSMGKRITISGNIIKSLNETNTIIEKITDQGLVACQKIDESDFIVAQDNEDIDRLKSLFQNPYTGQFITYDDFIKEKEAV